MSYHSRRILTPVAPRKRKDSESMLAGTEEFIKETKSSAVPTVAQAAARPAADNSLLAGYMAYEFLTKGTLLGQRLELARAEVLPVGPQGPVAVLPKRVKPEAEPRGKEHGSYAEVASILKTEGAHIPGIVNPGQLARWIQM